MNSSTKKVLLIITKILVSLGLMYLIFQKISISSVVSSLRAYTWDVLLTVTILEFLSIAVASWKWGLLLPNQTLLKVFRFTLIGQFYSFVLPGQVTGEIVKAFRFGQDSVTNKEQIVLSVLIDKIVSLLGLTILTCIGLWYANVDGRQVLLMVNASLLIFLLTLISLVSYKRANEALIRICTRWEQGSATFVASGSRLLQRILTSNQSCFAHQKFVLPNNLLASIAVHLILVAKTYIFSVALGIDISYLEWTWIYGMVSLATFMPVSIAGIGVREGVFMFFITSLGGGAESAIALSLSIFSLQVVTSAFGGMLEFGSAYKKLSKREGMD